MIIDSFRSWDLALSQAKLVAENPMIEYAIILFTQNYCLNGVGKNQLGLPKLIPLLAI